MVMTDPIADLITRNPNTKKTKKQKQTIPT